MADKNFNCSACKKLYSESVRDRKRSCFTPKEKEVVNYNGMVKYFVCPSNFFSPAYVQIIDMFRHFKDGILPFSGGLIDQPSKLIDLFNIVQNLENERLADSQRNQKWQTDQSRSKSPLKKKKPLKR